MPRLRDQPIPKKITYVIMGITAVVLLLAFGALFYFQACILRQQATHELSVVGEITARECGAAVRFKDEDAASQIINGLKGMPQIASARLELNNRQRLAFFGTPRDESEIKSARLKRGLKINGDRIILAQPVMLGGTQEGTLCLLADLRATTSQLVKLYGSIFTLVLLASLLVAFVLSGQFLRFVTDPILRLADAARTVADHNDYSVRATKTCNDEVGVLTDAFNLMLDQIQSQDSKLRGSEEKLAQAQHIAHLGYWERDLKTELVHWSDETYRIFGLEPQESAISFNRFQQVLHPEDREMVTQTSAKAISGGPRYNIEYRALRPDGEIRFIQSQGDVVKDSLGQPVRMFGIAQDVTEQKRSEQALRDAEQKYRAIFENSIEGIFQSTPDGKFISGNPALARVFGYDSPEDLIASVTDIEGTIYVDPDRREEFKRLIQAQGSVELFEYEVFRKDKSKLWLCENSRVVRDSEGKIVYYEGTVEDITERKRVEEVERASKAKSEFLSRMSHELRTPLNAILGFGQLLDRQSPTPVQKNRISHILNAGRHLLNLINEILDIARVESGRFQLSMEPVVVEQAVEEAIDLIRPMAADRDVAIERSALPENSPSILADRQRLKQVLLNLLSNAVKYNRRGGRVVVDLTAQDEGRFRISVSDEGPGIPPDKRARLFSPFDRLGAERTDTQGTGLGLALSKRLTEAMGGAIGEGGPAMGACFWIEFPLVKGVEEQIAAADRSAAVALRPINGETKTLLYIEDNLSNLSLVEHLLGECAPIKLISAMQGELGIELATRHQPDMILLDVHLPDINGADVLARLKTRPRTRDIPVVILSADATRTQVSRLLALGADEYLTKPLDVDCFLKVIEEHFCEPVSPAAETQST
jgi:PAS domain S-box-containing protein